MTEFSGIASTSVFGPKRLTTGRACPLCPGRSDINLFRYRECVVYFDPEIAHCALDLRVTEQELDGPQVACASVASNASIAPNDTYVFTAREGL